MCTEICWVCVVTHEALELSAWPDLLPRRLEDSQGINEEPLAEGREGKFMPHHFGQQHWEVKAIPA